jgi:hypothetical protein
MCDTVVAAAENTDAQYAIKATTVRRVGTRFISSSSPKRYSRPH